MLNNSTIVGLENRLEIILKDNGRGIPEPIIDKIFHPFFTNKPTGRRTGLGLSLVYDILKAYGGDIKVKSQEEEGCRKRAVNPNCFSNA